MIAERVQAYIESLQSGGKAPDGATVMSAEVQAQILNDAVDMFVRMMNDKLMTRREDRPGRMYATAVTKACARQAAYKYFGFPVDKGDKMPYYKFLNYAAGDIAEILVLTAARLAGCDIARPYDLLKRVGEEDRFQKMTVSWQGQSMPCYPDGIIQAGDTWRNVEIKKISDPQFDELERTGELDDSWGYRTQTMLEVKAWQDLGFPVAGTQFVAVRGLSGKVGEWAVQYDEALVARAFARKSVVEASSPSTLPERHYEAVPEITGRRRKRDGTYTEGKPTGLTKLGLACGYCGWKHPCWDRFGNHLEVKFTKAGNPIFYVVQDGSRLKDNPDEKGPRFVVVSDAPESEQGSLGTNGRTPLAALDEPPVDEEEML